MSASSSDGEERGDVDTWSDFDGEGAEEEALVTRCLFSDDLLPSPAAALQRASESFGFDFARLRSELKLDFYGCIKVVNFVRAQERGGCTCSEAGNSRDGTGIPREVVTRLLADVRAGKWNEDAFLTPALADDPLLFGLDVEDEDIVMGGAVEEEALPEGFGPLAARQAGGAGSLSSLRAENESLKLQLLELMSRTEAAAATTGTAEAPLSEAPVPGGLQVDRSIARRAATEHVRAVDASYFESYSYFTIHREMLGDAPRTVSYRDALERNPALLAGAKVLDVGCGTGILSLFAARAGAAAVVGVDGSARMAAVATALVAANGYGPKPDGAPGPVRIVSGKFEELQSLPFDQFDVIVSEWMGYCLLFESMLDTVLHARDRFLKPGGAVLPDVATYYIAGVSREASGVPFWDDVYGFDFSHVGREMHGDALNSRVARVLPVAGSALVTQPAQFKSFDLTTMAASDVEFTSEFHLRPLAQGGDVACAGVVVWFDTAFSARFCAAAPVVLTTSPHAPATHWAQTLFDFKTSVTLSSSPSAAATGSLGSAGHPAASLWGRISVARSPRHRSLDVSIEFEPRNADGAPQPELRQVMLYEV